MAAGDLAREVHALLLRRGWTVACAESLTGGRLADLLSSTPGASATFRGGVVSYATDVKVTVLGVSSATIDGPGAVSAACASEMAVGVRRLLDADVAVSTTGVAGPDRQEDKPAGTVFVGLSDATGSRATRLALEGERAAIREQTCDEVLRLLVATLAG